MNQEVYILLVDAENVSLFEHMIPDELMNVVSQSGSVVIGALGVDEIPMGIAIFREYAHYMELLWTYVEPEFRRIGICSAFFEKMMDIISDNNYFAGIYADYVPDSSNMEFDSLLDSLGFEKELQDWSTYHFTLKDTVELRKFGEGNIWKKKNICSIFECTSDIKNQFSQILFKKEEPYPIELPIQWKMYNEEFSCACVEQGKISAIFLLEVEENDVNIAFVYAKDNPYILPYMMSYSFRKLNDKFKGETVNITVTTFDENTEKLLLKIVPGATNVEIMHAQKNVK